MKHFVIRADIEGVSGVVHSEQAEPGKPEFAFGLRMFQSDLLAVLAGLFNGGADLVTVYDMHYYGRNVDVATLPVKARLIAGKPSYSPNEAGGLDGSCSGLVLLGFHSKVGTQGGLLAHTYEPDILDIRLNGLSVGEIGIEAAVAGDFGVPLILYTGDSAGAVEARALVPGLVTAVVKESMGAASGLCYALDRTLSDIRKQARRAARNCATAVCFRVEGKPVMLEVDLADGFFRDEFARRHPGWMSDRNTVRIGSESTVQAWSLYMLNKNDCYAALRNKA